MSFTEIVKLGENESLEFFKLDSRPAGTYVQLGEIRGNSLLSSLFISSMDPGTSIKINYFDATTGIKLGERFELEGHDLVENVALPKTFRIVVPRIHNRVFCEAIITGGSATFSVYTTVLSSFTPNQSDQIVTGSVSTSGLSIAGKITEVTINSDEWLPIPPLPLANRNSLGIQNPSETLIKLNYDNSVVGFVGVIIPAGGERFMDIKDNILIYGRTQTGSVTLNIEEIS